MVPVEDAGEASLPRPRACRRLVVPRGDQGRQPHFRHDRGVLSKAVKNYNDKWPRQLNHERGRAMCSDIQTEPQPNSTSRREFVGPTRLTVEACLQRAPCNGTQVPKQNVSPTWMLIPTSPGGIPSLFLPPHAKIHRC